MNIQFEERTAMTQDPEVLYGMCENTKEPSVTGAQQEGEEWQTNS